MGVHTAVCTGKRCFTCNKRGHLSNRCHQTKRSGDQQHSEVKKFRTNERSFDKLTPAQIAVIESVFKDQEVKAETNVVEVAQTAVQTVPASE